MEKELLERFEELAEKVTQKIIELEDGWEIVKEAKECQAD